jgi:hypothetical protein
LALLATVAAPDVYQSRGGAEMRWSPYYAVMRNPNGLITVNTIGHQHIVPFDVGGSSYSLIHLLQQHSGGAPFRDVLIIGAAPEMISIVRFGSGSTVSTPLKSTR